MRRRRSAQRHRCTAGTILDRSKADARPSRLPLFVLADVRQQSIHRRRILDRSKTHGVMLSPGMREVGIARCRLVDFAHNEQSASAAILDRSKTTEA